MASIKAHVVLLFAVDRSLAHIRRHPAASLDEQPTRPQQPNHADHVLCVHSVCCCQTRHDMSLQDVLHATLRSISRDLAKSLITRTHAP